MRFRAKTIVGVAIIELVLLAILVSSALSILRDSNEAELMRRVQLGGQLLAAAAKDAVISQDLATLDSLLEEAMNTRQIDVIRVYDSEGVLLSERGDKSLLKREFRKETDMSGAHEDGIFDWSTPVMAGGIKQGEVQLGVSISPLNVLLKSALRWAAGIAGLEMLLVALFSWLLGSYLVRQLAALRDASYRFAAGDFAHRIPLHGNDELTETAQAFNQMAQQLNDSHESLRREINERRLFQEIAEFAQSKAEDRNEQLNGIFTLSPDGFVSFDRERRVKYATPAFTQLTGIDRKAITGMDEAAFTKLLEDQCASDLSVAALTRLHKRHRSDDQPNLIYRERIEILKPVHRYLEVGLRESEAQSVSQILYFRDVTHEIEVDRIKSEFLSTAAHELRTPMSSIFGYTELMLARELEPDLRRESLLVIYKQSELMISIINELLDLSRIEARGGKDFNLEMLAVAPLLRDVIGSFLPPAERKAPIASIPDRPAIRINADQKKLTQAINNILSNAYKYSPDGGDVEVSLVYPPYDDLHLHQKQIGIRIADHGIGMTAEQIPRIFERFYRVDSSGKIPGTGLGMSIVKEIIGFHDGQVAVDSSPGKGTRVTIWLPVARGAGESAHDDSAA
ncbi:MAG: ATP-binding protein [Sideroxydans sp.]|nr:ATP-binding protein [Sideroxydans sp.]